MNEQFTTYDNTTVDQTLLNYASHKITHMLKNVHPSQMDIVVTDEQIIRTFNSFKYNFGHLQDGELMEKTILHIVNFVESDFADRAQKQSWDQWVNNKFEDYGLSHHPKIKLREKRPNTMIFNMRY